MHRTAVFVDAGYVFAQGSVLLTGTKQGREFLSLDIPGMVTFGTLIRAQSLGDFESLDKRDRRGARIHITTTVDTALGALSSAIDDAVSAKA